MFCIKIQIILITKNKRLDFIVVPKILLKNILRDANFEF